MARGRQVRTIQEAGRTMIDELTDPALVRRVRTGDRDAWLVLWRRHSPECRDALASVVDDPQRTGAVLRRAFARTMHEIVDGTDPVAPFRLHLRTTALLEACLDGFSDGPVPAPVQAFRALSRLDQTLVWSSLVQRATLRETAQVAGVPLGEVAVRARSAQSRLRSAWVDALLESSDLGPTCSWVVERLPVLQAGYLGPAVHERYRRHLRSCRACRDVVADDARFPTNVRDALLRIPSV